MGVLAAPIYLDGVPSLGSLLGTSGRKQIIDNLNINMGTNHEYFGSVHDIFAKGRQAFVQNVVDPIRRNAAKISQAVVKYTRPDVIMELTKEKDFEYIPPCMEMSILLYPPVYELFKQGRVEGFGYHPEQVSSNDYYGRLINNGTYNDDVTPLDDDGDFTVTYEYHDSDPELSEAELNMIENTREAVKRIIDNTLLDPTNILVDRS